jgi:hypothetical protein
MQRHANIARVAVAVVLLAGAAGSAHGQYIALKTVPVASGDQFVLFPSTQLSMGGVHLALDDALYDPFLNPAKGARVREAQLFATPTYYSITRNAGSAGAVSVGGLFGGRVFGGGMVALQQLTRGEQFFGPIPLFDVATRVTAPLPPNALSVRSATNKYGVLLGGVRLSDAVAVGASGFFAELNAMDGVEHLYAMASSIQQSGHMEDLRAGVTAELGRGRVLEATGVFRNFDMQHDVVYVDWVLVDSIQWIWEEQVREEQNLDRTRTWGAQVGYRQPVGTHGWRIGGALTGNWKTHPKIPNYEIMNIPRDPGTSTAFSLGVGVAKAAGPTTFGIDVAYEPASSRTWVEAEAPLQTASGTVLVRGDHTIDNEFDFSNAAIALGVRREVGVADLSFGLGVRTYDYQLDQWDHVAETFRRQSEQWIEWTPSWGIGLRLGDIEVRYVGRVTTGTGRPGVAWDGGAVGRAEDFASANDVLLAPSGPLTLQEVTVVTSQLSIAIPIR